MKPSNLHLLAAGGFLASILVANWVTSQYAMVPVGFGLMATAGTYFAGVSFIFRDLVQDAYGKLSTFALIVAGASISATIASPQLAVASAAAFLLAETIDLAVYTPLRARGYLRAAVASNVVGAVVDTIVFLAIAGFPIWSALPGQIVGKTVCTLVLVLAVVLVRKIRLVSLGGAQ